MERITDILNDQIITIMRLTLEGKITPEQAVRHIRLTQEIVQDRRVQVVSLSTADLFAASGL